MQRLVTLNGGDSPWSTTQSDKAAPSFWAPVPWKFQILTIALAMGKSLIVNISYLQKFETQNILKINTAKVGRKIEVPQTLML